MKVLIINLSTEEVEGPFTVRGSHDLTVREFKELLGRTFSMDPDKMRIILEGFYNENKLLADDKKTLKEEGFYRSNKVNPFGGSIGRLQPFKTIKASMMDGLQTAFCGSH